MNIREHAAALVILQRWKLVAENLARELAAVAELKAITDKFLTDGVPPPPTPGVPALPAKVQR
jgi:hypothetical protein